MSRLEYADRRHGLGSFPREWGPPPPGDQDDEQRAAWVVTHVRAHIARRAGVEAVRRNLHLLELRRHDPVAEYE